MHSPQRALCATGTKSYASFRIFRLPRELDSEGGVQSWTDFLKVRLHPRSVALLPGVWQGAADFSGFGHGRGALGSDEAREDALDRIRGFAEECDSLQACSLT